MIEIKLSSLKMGDAFTFEINGPVFVKCRGGFRAGCGGQLHACRPFQLVYRYMGVKHEKAI
jgi:hypothetical protein